MEIEAAIAWLNEAEKYFSNRPTKGEDSAHWSNVANSACCVKLALSVARLSKIEKAATFWLKCMEEAVDARVSDPYADAVKLSLPVGKALDKLAEVLRDQ